MPDGMRANAQPILTKTDYAAIPGWKTSPLDDALAAFRKSCSEIMADGRAFRRVVAFGGERQDWLGVCQEAARATDAHDFFEANFTPLSVQDPVRPEGLFTGYYEPEVIGSLRPDAKFKVPIYGKPDDLQPLDAEASSQLGLAYGRIVEGKPEGYFTRREIEEGALAGRGLELVWLTDWADAFFLQVQGSGRVRLPDRSLLRLAYAAKSGRPYTGIGGLLVSRGILSHGNMSMQALRAWMAENPAEARALMWENQSFVFFRKIEIDPNLGPPGAQQVSLTPVTSLAVDRNLWAFGTPIWLDTTAPTGERSKLEKFQHLMIAQDTGTAIKGHVRGDVFWGSGEGAGLIAGGMKSPGRMIVLLPNALAARLLKTE